MADGDVQLNINVAQSHKERVKKNSGDLKGLKPSGCRLQSRKAEYKMAGNRIKRITRKGHH